MMRPKKFLFYLIYDADRLTGFFKLSAEKRPDYKATEENQSRSPIIQCVIQPLVGDPGVLDGIGRVGLAELSLIRRDVAGFLNQMSAHGVADVMSRVPPYPGQLTDFAPNCIYHPGIQSTVAEGVGISKLIDFVLYFQDNAWNSAQQNFPIHRLIV
jgi:hypothetical protein